MYLLSRLQDNRHAGVAAFMKSVGLQYHPADLRIRRADLTTSLLNLRRYVGGRCDLWSPALNERDISPSWVDAALATLKF